MAQCRLCYLGKHSQFVNIFDKNYDPPIWKIIVTITNLKIFETDPYTKSVCYHCFDLLKQFDMFLKTILYTEWKIRQNDNNDNNNNNDNKQQLPQDVIKCWHYFHGYCPPAIIEGNDDDYNIYFKENETDDCDNDFQDDDLNTFDAPMYSDGCSTKDYQSVEEKIDIEQHPLKIENDDDFNESVDDDDNKNEIRIWNQDVKLNPSTTINDDYVLVEEKIEIEENPLKIEDDENIFNEKPENNKKVINCELNSDIDTISDSNKENEFTGNHDYSASNESANMETQHMSMISSESSSKNSDILKPNLKLYKCNICNRRFFYKRNLAKHSKTHTDDFDTCDKKFMHKTARMHNKKKFYCCNICSKKFSMKNKFKIHLRMHTDEKPYHCDKCGTEFSQKCHLYRHVRVVHTSEKPYECDICAKKFSQKCSLQRHVKRHTGDKPYECNRCDKKFVQKYDLERHVKVHTGDKPYECDTCGKKFVQKGDLQRHVKVHVGTRPYECYICAKKFTRKSSVQRHVKVHTSERPYCCNICKKTFALKVALRRHSKRHTNK